MSLKLTGSSAGSVSVDAPASTTGSADFTLTLPVAVGSAGQFIKNSSTPGTLEFGGTPNSQVCFAARLTSSQTISDNTTTKIILNTIEMNVGSGYDASTGLFTVPAGMGGRYVFGYSLRAYDIDTDDTCDGRLYHNGAHTSEFFRFRRRFYSHMANGYAYLGSTSIVDISASDTVALYVNCTTGSNSDVQTNYTSLYGYKIED